MPAKHSWTAMPALMPRFVPAFVPVFVAALLLALLLAWPLASFAWAQTGESSAVPGQEEAARVVDRFLEASGGYEQLRAMRSYAAEAEPEVYGNGYSLHLVSDGRFRVEAADRVILFDGRDHWLSYRGLVAPVTGDALGQYRDLNLNQLLFHGLLDASGKRAPLAYAGTQRVHGRSCHVLIDKSQAERKREYDFDAQTGLLERIVETVPDPELRELKNIYTFSDYQTVGGMVLPTRTHGQCLTDGSEVEPLTRFSNVRVNEPVDETLFTKPQATAPAASQVGDALAGQVLALSGGGSLITNITKADLEKLGVADSTAIVAVVRDHQTELLYRDNPDLAAVSPGSYLAMFNGTPALWLVKAYQGMRSDDSTYAAGDAIRLTKAPASK